MAEAVGPIGELAAPKQGTLLPGDDLAPNHAKVLAALPARKALTSESLARATGLSSSEVRAALGVLDTTRLVVRQGEGWRRAPASG